MSIWNEIIDFFTGDISDWLADVFRGSTALALEAVKDIALDAVTQLVNTDLTNEDKRNKAFETILIGAEQEGVKVTTGIINLAIEMAVQSLKD